MYNGWKESSCANVGAHHGEFLHNEAWHSEVSILNLQQLVQDTQSPHLVLGRLMVLGVESIIRGQVFDRVLLTEEHNVPQICTSYTSHVIFGYVQ